MIWSIREARARVEGEGWRRRRGWRRLDVAFVIVVTVVVGVGLLLFAGGGERGAVSVLSSVGSRVGCSDGSTCWMSGV